MTRAKVTSLAEVRVRAMLSDAEPQPHVPKLHVGYPQARNGVDPGQWTPGPLGLPEDCPIEPLGVVGDALILLDTVGQVRELTKPYGKLVILNIFGGQLDYLEWAWPRWGKDKAVNGFDNDLLFAQLVKACKAKGVWESKDRLRGRGCWTDGGGNLVVHTGDRVYIKGRPLAPGEYEGKVYPTRARIERPFKDIEDMPFDAVPVLRPALRTWNWARPDVDPHLLIGWLGGALLGGALPWRPMVYLTGDKGTGKSTLQDLIKGLLGSWLVQSIDATAAGIYQHLRADSLPVALDEFEGEEDNRRKMAILKLARGAASGGGGMRGGAEGHGTSFEVTCSFIFSSINNPPLRPQDLSRMALLRLQKLRPGTERPPLDPTSLGVLGRCMLTQLMREWPRFHETFNAFAKELERVGMDGRGQAQFGTLLACADMLEHEGWNEERLRFAADLDGDLIPWGDLLKPEGMIEWEDQSENWRACLSHMLSVRVDAWRAGTRHTVGQVLQAYWDDKDDIVSCNTLLAQAGLRIVFRGTTGRTKDRAWLAVHNQGPLVRELFDGSIWAGEFGAGLWMPALRQGPRGTVWEPSGNSGVRINGDQRKATLVSLRGLYGEGGVMGSDDE